MSFNSAVGDVVTTVTNLVTGDHLLVRDRDGCNYQIVVIDNRRVL